MFLCLSSPLSSAKGTQPGAICLRWSQAELHGADWKYAMFPHRV